MISVRSALSAQHDAKGVARRGELWQNARWQNAPARSPRRHDACRLWNLNVCTNSRLKEPRMQCISRLLTFLATLAVLATPLAAAAATPQDVVTTLEKGYEALTDLQ